MYTNVQTNAQYDQLTLRSADNSKQRAQESSLVASHTAGALTQSSACLHACLPASLSEGLLRGSPLPRMLARQPPACQTPSAYALERSSLTLRLAPVDPRCSSWRQPRSGALRQRHFAMTLIIRCADHPSARDLLKKFASRLDTVVGTPT